MNKFFIILVFYLFVTVNTNLISEEHVNWKQEILGNLQFLKKNKIKPSVIKNKVVMKYKNDNYKRSLIVRINNYQLQFVNLEYKINCRLVYLNGKLCKYVFIKNEGTFPQRTELYDLIDLKIFYINNKNRIIIYPTRNCTGIGCNYTIIQLLDINSSTIYEIEGFKYHQYFDYLY